MTVLKSGAVQFWARYLYVPMMLIGANGVMIWLVASGYSWWWALPVYVGAVAMSYLAEFSLPYDPAFNVPHGDLDRDFLYFFNYEISVFNSVVLLPVVAFLRPWEGIWPHDWPLWQQIVMAVVIADFGFMMVHYISHKVDWLWKFHAVHHSSERLYGVNGLIKHPVQITLEIAVGSAPLIILGISQEVALLLGFAAGVQLLLQHSKADYELGPFKYVLSAAPVHRFHHVNEPGEGDVNFGLFLNIWDQLLGTFRFDPAKRFTEGDIGLADDSNYPKGYVEQLVEPFRTHAESKDAAASAVKQAPTAAE